MAKNIYDLDEDVIMLICSSYLDDGDIWNAAAASQGFRAVFRPFLYQSILWLTSRYERIAAPPYSTWNEIVGYPGEASPQDQEDPDHPPRDSRQRVRNAHLLWSILHNDRHLEQVFDDWASSPTVSNANLSHRLDLGLT
jgi:hypothetical protein